MEPAQPVSGIRALFFYPLLLALAAGTFALDLAIPQGYAVWIFYLVPLLLLARANRPGLLYPAAAVFTLFMALSLAIEIPYVPTRIVVFNRILGFGMLWTAAYLLTGRCKSDDALKKSEHRFRTSVETLLDGFAILSPVRDDAGRIEDFRYEYINEAGCRMNGRSREETLGRGYVEMFPALAGSEWLAGFIRTAETGAPFVGESQVYSGIFAGGEVSTRTFNVRAVKMEDGLAVSWIDVTEAAKTAEKMAWLASFPELNPNPVVEIDREGAICYVNPAGREAYPDLEKNGLSHPWLAGLEPILDRIRNGTDLQGSRIVSVGERHFHQVLYHVHGLRRIRIYGLDITERVRAEEASRQRAEELETVLEGIPVVVWIAHDPECLHITGNRTADEFLRLPRGSEASATAPAGERPEHFRVVKDGRVLRGDELPVQRAARGEIVSDFEERVEFTDGTVRHLVGSATPLHDSRGRPRGSVSAFVDITERKRMEEALRASLEEKDLLMRELSHRTKNNMQVIESILDLQAAESEDANLVGMLAEARNRIRAMALVHEKLYRSGTVSSLNMRSYAMDLVNSLLRAHRGASTPVKTVLELEELEVSLDMALPVGLIVNELVSNSLKHAFPRRKAGNILLSLRKAGGNLELRYRDDGPGLPGELDLPRVHTLGLRLVNNLAVRQLRGTMEIERGPGAEFLFRFPLPDSRDEGKERGAGGRD